MNIPIPKGFRGLRWEPTNEQEVVMLFGRLLDRLDTSLAIESIGTTFPDCKATDSEDGTPVCIEFELNSSHFFRDHRKRVEKCDWVVCWHDDWDGDRDPPRIVALDKIAPTDLIVNRPSPSPRTQDEAFKYRIGGLSSRHQEAIQQLLHFGETELTVAWPETNGACFTVRGPLGGRNGVEYFKVGSHGTIAIPFSRWKGVPPILRADVAKRLNAALGTKWFAGQGKASRDILELMKDADSVQRFIGVWKRFVDPRANTYQPSACQ